MLNRKLRARLKRQRLARTGAAVLTLLALTAGVLGYRAHRKPRAAPARPSAWTQGVPRTPGASPSGAPVSGRVEDQLKMLADGPPAAAASALDKFGDCASRRAGIPLEQRARCLGWAAQLAKLKPALKDRYAQLEQKADARVLKLYRQNAAHPIPLHTSAPIR